MTLTPPVNESLHQTRRGTQRTGSTAVSAASPSRRCRRTVPPGCCGRPRLSTGSSSPGHPRMVGRWARHTDHPPTSDGDNDGASRARRCSAGATGPRPDGLHPKKRAVSHAQGLVHSGNTGQHEVRLPPSTAIGSQPPLRLLTCQYSRQSEPANDGHSSSSRSPEAGLSAGDWSCCCSVNQRLMSSRRYMTRRPRRKPSGRRRDVASSTGWPLECGERPLPLPGSAARPPQSEHRRQSRPRTSGLGRQHRRVSAKSVARQRAARGWVRPVPKSRLPGPSPVPLRPLSGCPPRRDG